MQITSYHVESKTEEQMILFLYIGGKEEDNNLLGTSLKFTVQLTFNRDVIGLLRQVIKFRINFWNDKH